MLTRLVFCSTYLHKHFLQLHVRLFYPALVYGPTDALLLISSRQAIIVHFLPLFRSMFAHLGLAVGVTVNTCTEPNGLFFR